jgi:hypothetical protein
VDSRIKVSKDDLEAAGKLSGLSKEEIKSSLPSRLDVTKPGGVRETWGLIRKEYM